MRLLDLPDEALELIAAGRLSEGHGRAILTTGDHDARRRLAQQAADEGWSVRETEIQARELEREPAPRSRRRSAPAHPDQLEAAAQLETSLARILGTQVDVAPRGEGYRITMTLAGPEDVTAFATRLTEFGVE
jgi:ParB family transcriptional regulator, chromosome partitioning protein